MADRDSADRRALALLDTVVTEIPGAEHRSGQREMTAHIATAIERGRPLVVRAGTGTGKTLAYLVPAIASGTTAVVVTATKALQDQLAHKDLPFLELHLADALGRPLDWAVLKGRSNYVCRQRLDEITGMRSTDRVQLSLEGLDDSTRAEALRLAEWAESSPTGDVTELDWAPMPATIRAVTVGSDECPGASRCPRGEDCFAEAARARAQSADVIVVNAHLYGLDIAAGGAILGPHDLVIFDEAHVIEDVMSDTVGVQLTPGRLTTVATTVRRILVDPELDSELSSLSDDLATVLGRYPGERLGNPVPGDVSTVLGEIRSTHDRALKAVGALEIGDEDAKQRRLRAQVMLTRTLDIVDRLLTLGSGDVAFVSGPAHSPTLEVAPLDVGPTMAAGVWEKRTAVLTSATVPMNLAGRIGLEGAELVDVGSPFDYEEQALLYCAMHLPPPNDARFRAAVHDELEALILAAGGRTLALFTSWSAMDEAATALADRIPQRILTQRDLPKPALLQAFAADEGTCLFATAGLFQGVDIPGRTLSLVVIDRIPFPRPDDPLLSARRDLLGPRAFSEIDLPRAATMLAQATGRLIRTDRDRGVVAVMDRRLGSAKYRWEIISALPPMRRTRERSEAVELLRSIADG
ncbi:MAG: ATP-dependent DNA helicase [Ilumatobacteraceae bacterium]